jgi:shikimate kinase
MLKISKLILWDTSILGFNMSSTPPKVPLPLFLVGYMGSGKSTLGQQLATNWGCSFLDLDNAVEEAWGISIAQGVAQWGELKFRKLEHAVLQAALKDFQGVMALGGGTPLYYQHMDDLLQAGTVVWLDPPLKVLIQRLAQEKASRPLLAHLADADLPAFVGPHLLERRAVYVRAHVRLAQAAPTVQEVLDALYDREVSADK